MEISIYCPALLLPGMYTDGEGGGGGGGGYYFIIKSNKNKTIKKVPPIKNVLICMYIPNHSQTDLIRTSKDMSTSIVQVPL